MRGHIRQRGKKSWSIVLDLGRDPSGKRRQKWHTVHGTKRDAQRELTRLLHSLNTGEYVEPSKLTVGEYLNRWLSDYAKIRVSIRTYERYSEIVRLHLIPSLGNHLLPKLQPLHIQECNSRALESGRIDGKGGLSPQTVLHHHRVLSEALHQAVRWQLLTRNPADAVEPPRPKRKEFRAPDEAEIAVLLESTKNTPHHVPIFIAATTGMRMGEILGLRWKDVDLKESIISVRQAIVRTSNGLRFHQPKTLKGRRLIPLPQITVDRLGDHRRQRTAECLALGMRLEDTDLVCCAADGTPIDPCTFSKTFASTIKKLGLRKCRFHDLRHGHATQLLRHGIHPKVVNERLGHSSIGITLDVYSHVLPSLQEEAAKKIDAALREALDNVRAG